MVERQLQELGVSTARVLSGGLETHGRGAELRDVVAVLVTPVTTHTALADPVDWVVEEGGGERGEELQERTELEGRNQSGATMRRNRIDPEGQKTQNEMLYQ